MKLYDPNCQDVLIDAILSYNGLVFLFGDHRVVLIAQPSQTDSQFLDLWTQSTRDGSQAILSVNAADWYDTVATLKRRMNT